MFYKLKELFSSDNINQSFKLLAIVLAAISIFSLVAVNFMKTEYVLAIDLTVFILVIFIRYINFGFYAMIFLYPFVGWQLFYKNFDAPYVDIVALLLLTAYIVRLLIGIENRETSLKLKKFPGLIFALLFFAASALSLFNSGEYLMGGLKYLLRPLIFFYIMFVCLPFNVIKGKKILRNVLRLISLNGVIVSFIGIMAVVSSSAAWYMRRAIPYSFGNFDPLGGNQNAIAETLAVAIPCTLILFVIAKAPTAKNWFLVLTLIMSLILVLTFSRAGWLALLVEMLILLFAKYRRRFSQATLGLIIGGLIIAPAMFYFTVWHNLDFFQSSNANRIMMTKIALYNFLQHPIIGNGLDSFKRLLGLTYVYIVEFANPLDSHGFVQKILTESGILGFLTFIIFLGYLFKQYLRAYFKSKQMAINRNVIILFIAMFAGIVAFELFSTSYFIAKTWLPIGVGLIGVKLYSGNR